MADQETTRKLAAILIADVFGYSRLMGSDEEATVRTLTTYRQVFLAAISQHQGRFVDATGDALLAEFPAVTDAVRCAVAIQQELAERNAALPVDRQMFFRIGVNLGEVLVQGEEIYGDGINVAARLESLADPGGICVSGTVYDSIQSRLGIGYEPMGEQTVKNIRQPVRAYRVIMDPEAASGSKPAISSTLTHHRVWLMSALAVVLVIAGVVTWQMLPAPEPPREAVSKAVMPSLDPRRIAVLPLSNISSNAGADQYFVDGMTEELISKLSKLHDLTVIARTSVMKYKETGQDVAEIGHALKVGTILEGSVRKAGTQLRISVQLVDVASQGHLWAQDYDRELQDVFAIQRDVAQQVAEELQVELLTGERELLAKQGTANLEAYTLYLKGRYQHHKFTKESFEKSLALFEQSLSHDPEFAQAYAWKAFSYQHLGEWGYLPPNIAYPQARAAVLKALQLDATASDAHLVLALVRTLYDWDWAGAEASFKRALQLNPGSANAHNWYGILYLTPLGRHEEAIAESQRAHELDPLSLFISTDVGFVYMLARRFEQAIARFRQTLELERNFYYPYWVLGLAYMHTGQYEEGIAALKKAVALSEGDLASLADLGMVYGRAGQVEQAHQVLDTLKERSKQEEVPPLSFADVYVGLGDFDEAFVWLQKAYEARASWLIFLNVDARYDPMRSDPRFKKLLSNIRLSAD